MIRNLLFHPKVVLLDEVTAGLDEESKQAVHQFLVKAHQNGTTFIQVTHEIDEIANAEQKLVLENGGLHHEELSR
jgi:putative ABC transport system ATP-binding protein